MAGSRAGKDEDEWRALAARVLPLTGSLVASAGEAAAVRDELTRALALPPGTAKAALRRVFAARAELRAWLNEQDGTRGPDYRGVPGAPSRHLEVTAPGRVAAGMRVALYVRVLLGPADGVAALRPFDVPPEGAQVVVSVWAPGLTPHADLDQDLTVPARADSEALRFAFTAPRTGLYRVVVRVYRGGTPLGETAVQISAEHERHPQEEAVTTAAIGSMAFEPGEVTLQVNREADHYRFQLLTDALELPVRSGRLAGDPAGIVERLAAELGRMASGESDLHSPALVRRRLQSLGTELWGDVVPDAIRAQFWRQADRITAFTVASELDDIPWELLYPLDGDNEAGFLAERVPIVRRVYGQRRPRRLALPSVAYVRPAPGPSGFSGMSGLEDDGLYDHAAGEIEAVRDRLADMEDRGVIEHLDELVALLDGGPAGVLHFAGHHAHSSAAGGEIRLHGGALYPEDLTPPARRGGWPGAPLVFLNGCRTAGEVPRITTTTGWARQFMRAGASAFIGSLWAVRSRSAALFAGHFYEHLMREGTALGQASLHARRAIMDEAGDPTWLAYTVYGNPSATVAGR
ncbi:CHAT domain-containing protein [Sphaerisporangium sp. B11E5]|uniref:CHAT domain-containing protein n=1 Tax=Sphaerisporangium sp. B11E5 TaxID=3153563 RepID=UPI00325E8C94